MSEPSPEVYETGRGMDAHNAVMREIRGRNEQTYDPAEPTRVWLDEDNTPDGVKQSLTIILNTGGCRWARAGGCTMCGYVAESVEGGSVGHENLMTQIEACLDYERENLEASQTARAGDESAELIKIYTSGSFLDEREVPAETRRAIADAFADRERIVVESLPDFVDREKLADFVDRGLNTDVAVGLETATDRVRHDCVNKYFDFADFEAACAEARAAGGERLPPDERAAGGERLPPDEQAAGGERLPPDEQAAGGERLPPDERASGSRESAVSVGVKAYLLVKPPFLTEREAVVDMKESVRRCAAVDGCHTVSVNPTNVQRYTMVEELHRAGGYRPPWLWSICEILESTADADAIVISDPVGHGSDRGPHNCGDCDDRVQTAIKDFDLRQDPSVFEQVSCECELTWQTVLDRERSVTAPLTT